MKKIKMNKTDTGSPDGLHTIVYGVGKTYPDVPDALADKLIKKKSAKEVKENGEK